MSSSLNKCQIIGNVGKDPEIRSAQDGREIASFSLATSESWKDKATGEKREKTEWHKVVVFSEGLVKVVKNYVKKGDKLYVEGSIQTRKWEKDGVERYTTEIVLQGFGGKLVMLSGRDSVTSEKREAIGYSKPDLEEESLDDLEDSIPF